MIVRMKKVAVIMQSKDAASALEALRAEGLMHIEHQQPPKGKDLALLYEDAALLDQALDVLSEAQTKEGPGSSFEHVAASDWKAQAHHVIDLWKRLDYLQEYSRELAQKIEEWLVWGDFDPDAIRELAAKGVYVKLYSIPKKEIGRIPQRLAIENIAVKKDIAYFAAISREKIECPFKEIELPKMSLGRMRSRIGEDKRAVEALEVQIRKSLCYSQSLKDTRKNMTKEIEFHEALTGMGESPGLMYLVGYAPAEHEQALLNLAKKEKWAIFTCDPAEDDNVPVLLKNPKLVSLINPLFKLMELVPGYSELDVSPVFLLFLSLFFGMIIGDAGYGAVYFLLTFIAQRKLGNKVKDNSVFFLFYLFSSCAILWGLLTGTVFGQAWYVAKGFKALVPVLNQAKFLMSFCFFLGALQLSLAHGWQAMAKLPSPKALADAGFICLLWAGFFLAKMFIVGDPFPSFGKWLIWAGILLIIFFSNPQKNIFKAAISGLSVLALGLMGNFGDVVSYIRLFAVGLASVAVADSVNSLAAGAGNNIIAQTAILFIGHSINIILGPVSVLVHGIRLNVLEFSLLHGNVTWSGLAYKPLRS